MYSMEGTSTRVSSSYRVSRAPCLPLPRPPSGTGLLSLYALRILPEAFPDTSRVSGLLLSLLDTVPGLAHTERLEQSACVEPFAVQPRFLSTTSKLVPYAARAPWAARRAASDD